MMTFDDILALVGTLDDTPGENTPRERFRAYLAKSASKVGVFATTSRRAFAYPVRSTAGRYKTS
jgi:hypothetical protein